MKTTILRLLLGFALILPVMATEAAARVSPAGSIEVNGAQFSPLGVEIRSLSELSQIGPEIREAVVLSTAAQCSNNASQLIAYCIARETIKLSHTEIFQHLTSRLPEYMIPSAFVYLDHFPLNSNGKVDRRALLALDIEVEKTPHRITAPSNQTQKALFSIWSEVLQQDDFGINDNHLQPGTADVEWRSLYAALEAINYPGAVLLEIVPPFQDPADATTENILRIVEEDHKHYMARGDCSPHLDPDTLQLRGAWRQEGPR